MGVVGNVVDGVLLVFFVSVAVSFPILDSQICLPQHLFPAFMVELKTWYTHLSGDYLMGEKPHFFVGIAWVELLLIFPLCVASLYAMAARKPWFNTACLILGSATFTAMAAILGELILSKRAPDRLLLLYSPYLGFAVLTVLRGLFLHSNKAAIANGKGKFVQRKKMA